MLGEVLLVGVCVCGWLSIVVGSVSWFSGMFSVRVCMWVL